jgi:hypothetical protein
MNRHGEPQGARPSPDEGRTGPHPGSGIPAADAAGDAPPEPALRHALDHARAPRPRDGFRDSLRARFLDTSDLPARPVAPPTQPHLTASAAPPRALDSRPPRGPWVRLSSILAIAAAALLMFLWPSESAWRVSGSSDYVAVRVDGESFLPGDGRRLAAALRDGSLLEVEGGALELVLDQRVALSLASGTRAMLKRVPAEGTLGELLVDQHQGSLAVVTGPEFDGTSLRIQTPSAEVRVLGTEFALDVFPGTGTCVCCTEGSVAVFARLPGATEEAERDPAREPDWTVRGGNMGFVTDRGKFSESGEAMSLHTTPLASLRRVWD